MTTYTDLIVIPVLEEKIAEYRRLAETSATVWQEHGALTYVEVEADDAKPGKLTSFPQSVDLKPGETVIIALVTYRSRAHRDEVNNRAMKDPRIASMDPKTMPFDMKRMYFGGFKPFVGEAKPAVTKGSGVQPYLFFRGRCGEAIAYYKETLNAEVLMMMRFKDNPEKLGHDKVPAELDERIMHACLRINGSNIMMSDGMRTGDLDFQCMSLSVSVPDEADADRMFGALSKEGTVQMPLGKTFFSPRFGAVTDKFGVSWMLLVEPQTDAAPSV